VQIKNTFIITSTINSTMLSNMLCITFFCLTTINILHDHFGIKEDPIRFFSRCLNRQRADFFAAFLLCNPFVFVRM
jgi:hypothetical protein